jgi:hypothetical protein
LHERDEALKESNEIALSAPERAICALARRLVIPAAVSGKDQPVNEIIAAGMVWDAGRKELDEGRKERAQSLKDTNAGAGLAGGGVQGTATPVWLYCRPSNDPVGRRVWPISAWGCALYDVC